ncbi:8172_t:CDS:2 [Diversispora eburnea]|uniref:8172_t:CDS:1 n=1 Tax=Diversispora eburnea TaxID=1213867 RepID=A0A9N9F4N4_9GLOM|nr:8172_t:CDS:2 [Diversispora eburnea]
MGLCLSTEEKESRLRSRQIDKQIKKDFKRSRKEIKVLLLGSKESDKSAIKKQMKIINGYTKDELEQYRITVYKNLVDSAQVIVYAMRKLQLEPRRLENKYFAEKILDYHVESDSSFQLSPEIVEAIDSLWHDPIIPEVMEKQSHFYLMDSAPYFFAAVNRIGAPGYIPREGDALRAKTITTGVSETRFNLGNLTIHMFDIRDNSFRRKWIHCFENVTSIIFCVALNEYDQVLLEESGQNRIVESLILFESVINSLWFLRTSIILILNKIDLFRAKLSRVPLEQYFPDYSGGSDINKAAYYILWKFKQTNRKELKIFSHFSEEADTSIVCFCRNSGNNLTECCQGL